MAQRLHGDPLLALWTQRLGRAVGISAIASVGQSLLVLVLALGMTGLGDGPDDPAVEQILNGKPDAFTEAPSDRNPLEETSVSSEPETEAVPEVEVVRAALIAAGFPDLVVVAQGRSIALEGSVPDDAARRAALDAVLGAMESRPDSIQLVDRLSVGP